MEFRTPINLGKAHPPIDHQSELFLIGSCFSENIAAKLAYYKFRFYANPLGILYHPAAIETLLSKAVQKKKYCKKDLFYFNERWHCFDAHSCLSDADPQVLLNRLNLAMEKTREQLGKSSHVFITLGTAWGYRSVETDTIVGNCHKRPAKDFVKTYTGVETTVAALENIDRLIRKLAPHTNLVFSLSPVRHLKEGLVENRQSKAQLLTAIHQVRSPQKQVHYFPAYEIMMDDLRDYRFYRPDMIHPNETAIDYIWEQFVHCWLSTGSLPVMKAVENIQKGLAHKPFNPASKQHRVFLQNLAEKKTQLARSHQIHFED